MQLWPQTDFWGLFDFEGWVCNVRSGAKCNWNPIKLTGSTGVCGKRKNNPSIDFKNIKH